MPVKMDLFRIIIFKVIQNESIILRINNDISSIKTNKCTKILKRAAIVVRIKRQPNCFKNSLIG